jgi:hypothetical protein
VVGIAVGGRLANLNPALFGATLEIAVGQPHGETEACNQAALCDVAIALDRLQDLESDCVVTVSFVHGMNTIDTSLPWVNIWIAKK